MSLRVRACALPASSSRRSPADVARAQRSREAAERWWPAGSTWSGCTSASSRSAEPYATLRARRRRSDRSGSCASRHSRARRQPTGAGDVGAGDRAGWLRVTRFPPIPELPTLPSLLAGHRPAHGRALPARPALHDPRSTARAHPLRQGVRRTRRRGESTPPASSSGVPPARASSASSSRSPALRRRAARGLAGEPSTASRSGARLRGRAGRRARARHRPCGRLARRARACRPHVVRDADGGARPLGAPAAPSSSAACRELGEPARRLLGELAAAHAALASPGSAPVHGAPARVPVARRRRAARATRLRLARARRSRARRRDFPRRPRRPEPRRVPVDRLNAAFLSGYEDAAGRSTRAASPPIARTGGSRRRSGSRAPSVPTATGRPSAASAARSSASEKPA